MPSPSSPNPATQVEPQTEPQVEPRITPQTAPQAPQQPRNLPRTPPSQAPQPEQSLSRILSDLAQDAARERISVADLLEVMRLRAVAALLLIFALPNALPTPPGTSAVLGLPLSFLTFQLMLGQRPWLSGFIARKSMARGDFAALIARIAPYLVRAERLLRSRLRFATRPFAERLVGALCFILAVVLLLPIPLGNMLPAIAISAIALGILERDGLWILGGSLLGLVSLVIVSGVVLALSKAALYIFTQTFL